MFVFSCLLPPIRENPMSVETEQRNQFSVFPNIVKPPKLMKFHSEKRAQPGIPPGSLSMGGGVTVHSATRHLTARLVNDGIHWAF